MWRRHGDVLLAGLALVGILFCLVLVLRHFELGRIGWGALAFGGAVVASPLARRGLPRLAVGDTAIAAPIAMAIVVGIRAEYTGGAIEAWMVVTIALAAAGGFAGAYSVRWPSPNVARGWRVALAGFVGFGAAMLAGGIALVSRDATALATLLGGCAGSFIVAQRGHGTGAQCALSLGVVLSVGAAAANQDDIVFVSLGGFVVGLILGAIGGHIGEVLCAEPTSEPELPAAQLR